MPQKDLEVSVGPFLELLHGHPYDGFTRLEAPRAEAEIKVAVEMNDVRRRVGLIPQVQQAAGQVGIGVADTGGNQGLVNLVPKRHAVPGRRRRTAQQRDNHRGPAELAEVDGGSAEVTGLQQTALVNGMTYEIK